MATQVKRPSSKQERMQPLPQWPSPTLTNPDMVLPSEIPNFASLPSPPRHVRVTRPPSPGYLRERTNGSSHSRNGSGGSLTVPAKREKLGLMSRKMMLLRSRTASSGVGAKTSEAASNDNDSVYASSAAIANVSEVKRPDLASTLSRNESSGTDSDDMSALPQFLAKYESNDMSGTDDEFDDSSAILQEGYAESNFTSNLEAERRQKEEDEYNSAILSRRAEQILANAKKRLNLMEGNLRGARDLVAPLTAANLKRATSVASGLPYTSRIDSRNKFIPGVYQHDTDGQPYRTLQPQISSPNMARDYQGHWRGFSDTEMPERANTALDDSSPIVAQGYIPTKANDPLWTKTLKGSKSHDSLGPLALRGSGSRDPFCSRNSPDPILEPVVEDDDPVDSEPARPVSSQADSRDGSSRYTGATSPDDLHDQMNSLKGRISALKERAREDSLRRQSMQNMREPSPLNNAATNAPELFYDSSPTSGKPASDRNNGTSQLLRPSNPDRMKSYETVWESDQIITGSRNAFAEQAQRMLQQGLGIDVVSNGTTREKSDTRPSTMHRRTPSGTAIVQSSKHRYSHHQLYQVQDMQGVYGADEPSAQNSGVEPDVMDDRASRYADDEDSQAGASVYEEASEEPHQPVLAHEDRDDAFDYEKFFLHSAMAIHGNGTRRSSTSSEESVDSVSTARGPTLAIQDFDGDYFDENPVYELPGTPGTPETLRSIERKLHKRSLSDESVSTMMSFATATEGRDTPEVRSATTASVGLGVVSPSKEKYQLLAKSPLHSPALTPSESSSERADSGVSLNDNQDSSRRAMPSGPTHKTSLSSGAMTNSTLSPPMSPNLTSQDPATVIVKALLATNAGQLGLRDKALLFGLVESLKKLCHELQQNGEASQESRALRRRLDDARRVLAGSGEVRPGTS